MLGAGRPPSQYAEQSVYALVFAKALPNQSAQAQILAVLFHVKFTQVLCQFHAEVDQVMVY